MVEYRKGPHTVYDIQYHFVWVTKYRYHVLRGELAEQTESSVNGEDVLSERELLAEYLEDYGSTETKTAGIAVSLNFPVRSMPGRAISSSSSRR